MNAFLSQAPEVATRFLSSIQYSNQLHELNKLNKLNKPIELQAVEK